VVEVACLTECRSDHEQRSLLAVAFKVDRERSKETITNPPERRVAPFLERLADTSRVLEAGDKRIVTPSELKARRARR
jgi:hypothetical protein